MTRKSGQQGNLVVDAILPGACKGEVTLCRKNRVRGNSSNREEIPHVHVVVKRRTADVVVAFYAQGQDGNFVMDPPEAWVEMALSTAADLAKHIVDALASD
jgi:Ni,Fe-hydrogenase maturation factor